MIRQRPGAREVARVLLLAEVQALEELLHEHDVGALAGGFTHEPRRGCDVLVEIVAASELHDAKRHLVDHAQPPS